MERKVKLFIAASLDGYIAREDDRLDWLFEVNGQGDNGYSEFYETVDTVIMGRRTYDWLKEEIKGEFPYVGKKTYVFSRKHSQEEMEHPFDAFVRFISEPVQRFTEKIKQENGASIWLVGGSSLLQEFMKYQLVDEYFITLAPTMIGKGIPLFGYLEKDIKLTLCGVRTFNQFVELHYKR